MKIGNLLEKLESPSYRDYPLQYSFGTQPIDANKIIPKSTAVYIHFDERSRVGTPCTAQQLCKQLRILTERHFLNHAMDIKLRDSTTKETFDLKGVTEGTGKLFLLPVIQKKRPHY